MSMHLMCFFFFYVCVDGIQQNNTSKEMFWGKKHGKQNTVKENTYMGKERAAWGKKAGIKNYMKNTQRWGSTDGGKCARWDLFEKKKQCTKQQTKQHTTCFAELIINNITKNAPCHETKKERVY